MSLSTCPSCKAGKLAVVDSRAVGNGEACRRRYKCSCGVRFTTYEVVMESVNAGHQKAGTSVNLGKLAARRILGDALDPMFDMEDLGTFPR